MKIEKVYSPVEDKHIQHNLKGSPIWKDCFHPDELDSKTGLFEYTFKFDGLTPKQVTNIRKCR